MSISTKRGDDGETDLIFGRRVSKFHPRVEAGGALDELNASLGMARVFAKVPLTRETLPQLQNELVTVMAEVATLSEDRARYLERGKTFTTPAMVDALSSLVTTLEQDHGISFAHWAFPGEKGSVAGAALDVARTVCRRGERRVARLHEDGELPGEAILHYLNRLSDVLWLLARLEEQSGEPLPEGP